ncbi:hypothetical protein [Cyanobium sp. L1E-Cus]|uniref:hypothetical protein n=1 Tax=Cyanobium sp. L1E-Cus TaxID=2823714 RepID=UPI0020CF87C7|nr:hypothetical protein [Cyanobium sp. L1E-Cus]MCP9821946.1 hypothetical protein [Cyanobium sp. L1E-Cus]
MSLAIRLKQQQEQALTAAAKCLGVSATELAAAAVRDLHAQPSTDLVAAAQRVLEKHREVDRRLA